jgi:uncharacterized protein
MKLLVWLVIIAAVVMWFVRAKKTVFRSDAGRDGRDERTSQKTPGRSAETMLQCAQCGVHFPASEAVSDAHGAVYCSEQHRFQHAAR